MDDAAAAEKAEEGLLLGQEEVEEDLRRRGHLKIRTRRWRLEMKHSGDSPWAGKNDRMVFSYPNLSIFIPT